MHKLASPTPESANQSGLPQRAHAPRPRRYGSQTYFGNQAALRFSRTAPRIQTKLQVGATNDPLEAEADQVADRVMRMTDSSITAGDSSPVVRRMCTDCKKDEEDKQQNIQRKSASAGDSVGPAPESVHQVLSSPGRPLAAPDRAFFEPRLGADLSAVRIHDDSRAADSARSIGARAYTLGSHVAFAGPMQSSTNSGRRLLAHELAHVVQQGSAPSPAASSIRREPEPEKLEESGPVVDQKKCVERRGGCPSGEVSGIPTCEEIATYNLQCRQETHYDGPDVTADCKDGWKPDCSTPPPDKQPEKQPDKQPEQEQKNDPAPPPACTAQFAKASSFTEFLTLIRAAETKLDAAGITGAKDQIHAIRGIYYGTTWSLDYTGSGAPGDKGEQSTTRNKGFQRFTRPSQPPDKSVPTDITGTLNCGLFEALKASQDVGSPALKIDMGHVIIALDARFDPDFAKDVSYKYLFKEVPMGGTGTEVVTWLGDLGGGTGKVALERTSTPTAPASDAFLPAPSDYGGTINLEGDIAGYVVATSSPTALTPPNIPAGKKLSDALSDYVSSTGPGSAFKDRAHTFLAMNGGAFDPAGKLTNAADLIAKFAPKIEVFACNYVASRVGDKHVGYNLAKKASDNVKPISQEIAEIFIQALAQSALSGDRIEARPPFLSPKPAQPGACGMQIEAGKVLDTLGL